MPERGPTPLKWERRLSPAWVVYQRERRGMTQGDLAKACKVSQVFIHYLETRRSSISPKMQARILEALPDDD